MPAVHLRACDLVRGGTQTTLQMHTGHAERVVTNGGRVTGLVIDGAEVEADVVIVAAGRASRLADEFRAPGEGGACGFSYAARMYRARDGVDPPVSAVPMGALYRGYQAMVFPQDDRTLSALVVRPTSAPELAALRHHQCFEAATRDIPLLAPWTDPERFDPITDVLAGSGLSNTYRGQADEQAGTAGLFFVGDAVCTTNPAAGRGVSLGLRQASELVSLLENEGGDYRSASARSAHGALNKYGPGTRTMCIGTPVCWPGSGVRTSTWTPRYLPT